MYYVNIVRSQNNITISSIFCIIGICIRRPRPTYLEVRCSFGGGLTFWGVTAGWPRYLCPLITFYGGGEDYHVLIRFRFSFCVHWE